MTILPYATVFVPKEKSTLSLIWLSLDDNGFNGMQNYFWFNAMKVSTLIPLTIWFISSSNWWRYALFSPIILYSYQIWEANQDVQQLDAVGNLKAFPAILAIVLVLIVLSNVFKYRYGLLDMYDQLESEIDMFIEQAATKDLNELHEFRSLSAESNKDRSTDQYLEELYRLKQKIQYELRANT
ncbi:MAG: hypothetical protein WBM43_10380 [Flavobacteriaceae bacterium]